MTTYNLDIDSTFQVNPIFYDEQINRVVDVVVPQFESLIRLYLLFHATFVAVLATEFFLFLLFFNTIAESALIAMSTGAIFLTIFAYFILRLYLLSRKTDQIHAIKNRFLRGCRDLIQYRSGIPEHQIALATACSRLADRLDRKEYSHYQAPSWIGFLNPLMQRFSWWCHWNDYHVFKEQLLQEAVNENIELVKLEPTSLDVHASLANAYVMLSGLYVDPRSFNSSDEDLWVPEDQKALMLKKFRDTAKRAIEEFKILNSFAPDDPWVHTQLAYSYHDLQMPKEEIHEYEIIHKLVPHDDDCLYKLGALYFQQGLNAQGLEIYAKLCQCNSSKAQMLISHYG